jgi:hypothetical protein
MKYEWRRGEDGHLYMTVTMDDGSLLDIGLNGWIEFVQADHVRYREAAHDLVETWLHARTHEDGRIVIDACFTRSSRATSTGLDGIQLGRIEKLLNTAEARAAVQDLEGAKPIDESWPRVLLDPIREQFGMPEQTKFVATKTPDDSLTLDPPPRGSRFPDSFYERLAEAYALAGTRSNSPAKVLADANGLNTTTVHGWVKEARARGLLSPSPKSVTATQADPSAKDAAP